jgi:hypothetical protein
MVTTNHYRDCAYLPAVTKGAAGDVFRGSSPLSHIPVLRRIRPSMDIKRSEASHDEKNRRRGPRHSIMQQAMP